MSGGRLPVLSKGVVPSGVEDLRARLGGRAGAQRFAEAGSLVTVTLPGETRTGVVITADESGGYVWTGPNEVRRLPRSALGACEGPVPAPVEVMARTVRTYGALAEGSPVEFARSDGRWEAGRLQEKCRFGAIVAAADGQLFAVGFSGLRRPAD